MRGVRVILWEAPPGGDPVQGLPAARALVGASLLANGLTPSFQA